MKINEKMSKILDCTFNTVLPASASGRKYAFSL